MINFLLNFIRWYLKGYKIIIGENGKRFFRFKSASKWNKQKVSDGHYVSWFTFWKLGIFINFWENKRTISIKLGSYPLLFKSSFNPTVEVNISRML